jgi:hypothetical protein
MAKNNKAKLLERDSLLCTPPDYETLIAEMEFEVAIA